MTRIGQRMRSVRFSAEVSTSDGNVMAPYDEAPQPETTDASSEDSTGVATSDRRGGYVQDELMRGRYISRTMPGLNSDGTAKDDVERPHSWRLSSGSVSSTRSTMTADSGYYSVGEEVTCVECGEISQCRSDHKNHMIQHDKPFICDIPLCRRNGRGFLTLNDLNRHKRSVHRLGAYQEWYQCAAESCGNKEKIWPRLDNFKKHIGLFHQDEEESELIRKSLRNEPGVTKYERVDDSKGFNDLYLQAQAKAGVYDEWYRCAAENCRNKEKIWPRLDNFKMHIARMHKDEEESDLVRKSLRNEQGVTKDEKVDDSRDWTSLYLQAEEQLRSRQDETYGDENEGIGNSGRSKVVSKVVHHFKEDVDSNYITGEPPVQTGTDLQLPTPNTTPEELQLVMPDDLSELPPSVKASGILRKTTPLGFGDLRQLYSTTEHADESGEMSPSWTDMSDQGSAAAREDTILDPFRPALSLLIISTYQQYRTHQSGGDQKSGSDLSLASASSHQRSSSDPPGGKSGGKRKKNQDSEDNDENRPTRKKASLACEDNAEQLLACPFCKNNPRRYRDCYKYVLRDVSRLKQHLARRHRIPPHCPSCSSPFDSETDRDEHIRARTCEVLPAKDWDGIKDSQKRLLEKRISHKKSKEENWYIIYEILFPGAPRPRSPYVDTPLSEELLALREFASQEGPNIVSEFTRAELPQNLRPQEQEIQEFLETVFQDAVGVLLERYATTRPETRENPTSHSRTASLANSSDSGYSGGEHGNVGADIIGTPSTSSFQHSRLPIHLPRGPPFGAPNLVPAPGFAAELETPDAVPYPPDFFLEPLPSNEEWEALFLNQAFVNQQL